MGIDRKDDAMTIAQIATTVDARGLSCPMPIVKTALAVKSLVPGDVVEVLATDPGAQRDFVAWCRTTGHELLEQTADGPVYRFVISRK
jgi:tRNA 2-thiouridine synthesizing protein A